MVTEGTAKSTKAQPIEAPVFYESGRVSPYRLDYRTTDPKTGKVKRVKRFFASREEAVEEWRKTSRTRRDYGLHALSYDAEAHREWMEAKRVVGAGVSLVECAVFWLRHAGEVSESPEVGEGVAIFVEDKQGQGLSKHHVADLKFTCGRFAEFCGKITVREVDEATVRRFLLSRPVSARSIRNDKLSLANFLNYAKRRRWLKEVPEIHASDLPKEKKSPKGVLAPGETERMFAWLAEHRPEFIPWAAIQAFAGVRHAEADRFLWEWVDCDHERLVVPADICKTDDDWVIQGLPPALWNWLREYRSEGAFRKPDSKLVSKLRRRWVEGEVIKAWPSNALRHTFCTMHMSLTQSPDATAAKMRHQNTKQLWRSYCAKIVPAKVAEAYFASAPAKISKAACRPVRPAKNLIG